MALAAGKELRKFAKENDRRIVAMTWHTTSGSKCEFVGSVQASDVPEIAKLWASLMKLAGKGVPVT